MSPAEVEEITQIKDDITTTRDCIEMTRRSLDRAKAYKRECLRALDDARKKMNSDPQSQSVRSEHAQAFLRLERAKMQCGLVDLELSVYMGRLNSLKYEQSLVVLRSATIQPAVISGRT